MSSNLQRGSRSDVDRAKDLVLMARMLLRGHTLNEIVVRANEDPERLLPYTPYDADKDKKYLAARWREDAVQTIEEVKAKEIKALDNLEMEYWGHYDTFKDVRALAGIANVIQTRAKLHGLFNQQQTAPRDVRVVFAWDHPDTENASGTSALPGSSDVDAIEGEIVPE